MELIFTDFPRTFSALLGKVEPVLCILVYCIFNLVTLP